MGYPGSKVHRVGNRRKLGRGQTPATPPVHITASASTVTVTLTFDQPVVVSGTIIVNHSGAQTLVSQTQTSPTTVQQVYSATMVGSTYTIPAGQPVIAASPWGGSNAAASGTF
jgi:hypothetical protein